MSFQATKSYGLIMKWPSKSEKGSRALGGSMAGDLGHSNTLTTGYNPTSVHFTEVNYPFVKPSRGLKTIKLSTF